MIKNIGRYQVQGEIGKGGFGKVYRAWDPTVNRQVAIKILTVEGDDDLLTRFRNEAAAAGNLHHKNIVTVYDFGEHEGAPYMVMQLLEGENLQDIITRGTPLTLLDKLNIMQEVAEGLHTAHQHGIVHRDVKPANIMILPDESVQIMDFGIARVSASASRQTRTGFVIGTVLYMAPEQFLPNMQVDYRADIWAYGVIYYELLTGKHPFAAPEQTAILYQVAHVDPAPVNTLAPDCPPALADIVQRALMKDREFRYQSLKELQFDVQPILLDLKRERADELMPAARDLVDSGQIDEAAGALQGILELDPSNRDAHELLRHLKQLDRRSLQPRIRQDQHEDASETPPSSQTDLPLIPATPPKSPPESDVGEFTRMFRTANPAAAREDSIDDRTAVQPLPSPKDLKPPKLDSPVYPPGPPPPSDATILMPGGGANTVLLILETVDSSMIGRTIPIAKLPFSIGRAECDVIFPSDSGLSRNHAVLDLKDDAFVIRDLDSKNGTYVNGKRLQPQIDHPLPFGAILRLSSGTTVAFQAQHIRTMPDLSGLLVGKRFELTSLVHSSNKAATYLATDLNLRCTVAVKILSPQLTRYAGYAEQFRNQALVAASLRHPHICKIIDFGEVEIGAGPVPAKASYLCMEYMEGGSLASKLSTTEWPTNDCIARWLPPVAAALDHAHDQGVVHAGLKPTAIVFDKRDTPFVTDFAIASRPGNEKNWAVMGAPAFLAPEQWDGDMPTGKADQYSFAVVAYLLLTGSRPYEGQENPEVRRRNFARGAIPAHEEAHQNGRTGITRAVSSVLARAMATKTEARYSSVTEFAAALSSALDPRDRPTVFISYHRKTCTIPAIHFKEKLSSRHGISSFLDTERVDNPQPFPGRLRRAIEECDLFVCLLGAATLESKWVTQEIAIAHQNHKPMVPVFQEGFIWPDAGVVEPAVDVLLHQEGLELRVRRPEQIDDIIADLAHMVRNSTK